VRIVVAADHAGFPLKEELKKRLSEAGYEVADLGTHSSESTDYPDFGHLAVRKILEEDSQRGILFCGTGAGMAIAANRHKGIRAVVCFTEEIARLARAHNDANVLCLAARFVDVEAAWQITQTFLATEFEGGRHMRRIEKIDRS